jgi:predicted GNAT family acetyltransferase
LRVTVAVQDEGHDAADYREYAEATQRFQRAMVHDGVARWYGLFEGDRMLAALGLVGTDDFARFQRVETQPRARGRGLCSTLVWHVSSRALSQRPGRPLVMLADEGYHARHIYRSLGYRPAERILSLVRKPGA